MSDFLLAILVCSIGVGVLVAYFVSEYRIYHSEDKYKDELNKFFTHIRWFSDELDYEELASEFKNISELKQANKRIEKIIKKDGKKFRFNRNSNATS